jgi:hypothetical protein
MSADIFGIFVEDIIFASKQALRTSILNGRVICAPNVFGLTNKLRL